MSPAQSSEMKVTSILPYFGGKRNLAQEIIAELGPHRAYWEPFCGSLAVLLAKEPCSMETVNDLNGDVVNLARVLADFNLAHLLYDRLSRTLMHELLFEEAAERWKETRGTPAPEKCADLTRAGDYLLASWMGRNGVTGTTSYNAGFCVRYTKNGGHAAKRWVSVVDSIPEWHDRLRQVTILNRDAHGILDRIEDAEKVAIYCDPPYIEKGAKYVHDFEPGDHARLAARLKRFKKTRVVLSYYDHPNLDSLYPGWTKVHLKATKALVNQGMRDKGGATKAPEVLLINGPSLRQVEPAPVKGGLFA